MIKEIKVLRQIINYTYNYFNRKNDALDEFLTDPRNLELAGSGLAEVPENTFVFKNDTVPDQGVRGYTTSCVSQGTCGAVNTIKKAKAEKDRVSGFTMWDGMLKDGTGKNGAGAYLIDGIKKALSLKYINGYYQITKTDFVNKIRYALYYNTSTVVTGSNKIDWKLIKDTGYEVSISSSGTGHCFFITGFDDENQRLVCYNSYGEDYGFDGMFYIPYDLASTVLFTSTYGIVVDPKWSNNTQTVDNFNLIKG